MIQKNFNGTDSQPLHVAAIDIGTTKVVAAIGTRTETGKIELNNFSKAVSKGIRRGEVLNLDDASKVIRTVVSHLEERTSLKCSHVFVGVAGQHIEMISTRCYINRTHPDEKITAAEIATLKQDAYNCGLSAGKEIIHVIPQSFIIDDDMDIDNPIGMIGKRLEGNFCVITGNVDSLRRIRRSVEDTGLAIEEIILEPLASADAVLFPREKNTGIVLVDIGGGTTDIAIFYDDILRYSAVIPFGGNVISEDIRKVVGLTFEEAEKLKIEFGMALPDGESENNIIVIPCEIPGRSEKELSIKHLTGIIQARMEEIIDQIIFHLEQSGYKELMGSGIVITGGGAMLSHLAQLFSFKTGLSVRIGYPGQFLAGDAEKINQPLFATCVGLLMKGMEYMDAHPESRRFSPGSFLQQPKPVAQPAPVSQPFMQNVAPAPSMKPVEHSNDDIDNGFDTDEPVVSKAPVKQSTPSESTGKKIKNLKNSFSSIISFFEEKEDDDSERM